MAKTKSFDITKQMVYRAYRRIKTNKGTAGVDHISLEQFEDNLKDNLLSFGTGFPQEVIFHQLLKGWKSRRKRGK